METGKLSQIAGLRVDVETIASIGYRCEPSKCTGESVCCAAFDICVGRDELPRIAGCVPPASRYAPHLADEFDNPFEPTGDGLYSVETDEHGLCCFAFASEETGVLCSIHAAALAEGLDAYRIKPLGCALWPLSLIEGEHPVLTVDPSAWEFPCVRERTPVADAPLDAEIRRILDALYGQEFSAAVASAIHG
ncbi:MAG: hypothetical protein ACLFVU_11920 [Phycisphaerae bacterium]